MSSSPSIVNYSSLESQKTQDLQKQIQRRLSEKVHANDSDGIRYVILRLVVDGNYDKAVEDLEIFMSSKDHYPKFESRANPYKTHCSDLIRAIEAKRHFPGLTQLSASKHQELFDKVVEHFEELKTCLRKIEIVEKEEKLKDLRSTVLFVRTFWNCLFLLFAVFLANAFVFNGLGLSLNVVFDDLISRTLVKVFQLF